MGNQIILVQEEPRGPSELVEVEIDSATKQRFPFPDVEQLRNQVDQKVVIKGLRLVTADVLTNGILTGGTNAPATELQKMTLTLYSDGWEKMHTMPVLISNDTTVPGGNNPHRYISLKLDNWQGVQWQKCYIQFANGTVPVNPPYVVMFDIEYIKLDKNNQPINGPS